MGCRVDSRRGDEANAGRQQRLVPQAPHGVAPSGRLGHAGRKTNRQFKFGYVAAGNGLDGTPSRCAAAGRHVLSLGRNWSRDAALLDQRDVAASGVPGRARPRPILRLRDQPATIGICEHGLDFRGNGLGFVPIPIVPLARVAGTDAILHAGRSGRCWSTGFSRNPGEKTA
jgi:hypothetical protein